MQRFPTDRPATPDADEIAVERYRYLLRTAPPDQLEQAHAEAFAALSPAQRRMVLDALTSEVEPAESRGVTDDPRDLARLATRTELRRPGTIERVFGGEAGSRQGGGFVFGGFLPTLAGAFMGTAIASMLFGGLGGLGPGDAAAFDGDAPAVGGDAAGDAFGDDGGRSSGGGWAEDPGSGDGAATGEPTGAGEAGGFDDLGGFGDFGGGDFGGFDI